MKAIAAKVRDENAKIHPFRVAVPEAELVDLRRRIQATRWPERVTISDESQGVQLAMMQDLASYWATGYNWRVVESLLNTMPQFVTEIDGLDIHFIHARSKHKDALPLIVRTDGLVRSSIKIIDPLINPIAHGGAYRMLFTWFFRQSQAMGIPQSRPRLAGDQSASLTLGWH
jgi:Epoxide hydrolase N terminus